MNLFFTIAILFSIVIVIIYMIRNNRNPNEENVVVAKYDFSAEENEINSNEELFEGNLERLPLEIYEGKEVPKEKEIVIDEVLDKIEDELSLDNISTEIKEHEITWIDNFGDENSIFSYMTATDQQRIAWWQCNEAGKDLVRIKLESGITINWRPPINTMGLSSQGCGFINFFSQFLIVMYTDKHTNRIFAINTTNLNVEEINFYGNYRRIKQVENEIFVTNSSTDEILKMTIFEDSIKREMVSLEYLKERNIKFGY
jgi:hypothetical protein